MTSLELPMRRAPRLALSFNSALLTAALLTTAHHTAASQVVQEGGWQPAATLTVHRAAAEYLVATVIKESIALDPRILEHPAGQISRTAILHTDAILADLAGATGVDSVLSLKQATDCGANLPPAQCRSGGRVALLTIAEPNMEGDSATVMALVRTARAATAADSAVALKSASPEGALRRLDRLGSMQVIEVRLGLNRTTGWHAVRHRITGTS